MKKRVLGKLAVIAFVFAIAGGVAFGATEASLDLTGTVAQITWVQIDGSDAATRGSLDFSTEETGLVIPTTYFSNDDDGFVIQIKSLNGSELVSANTSETIAYTVAYGGLTGITADYQTALTIAYTGNDELTSDITISWEAQPNKPAETYTDTINLLIVNQ